MKGLVSLVALVTVAFAAPLDHSLDKVDLSDPKATAPVGLYNNLTFFRPVGFAGNMNGGQGGSTWTCWDPWRMRDALDSNIPRIIIVRGRLDLGLLFTGSPGVRVRVGPDTTITGGDRHAEITGGGLQISNVHNVIVENLKFNNALSYASGEQPNGNNGIVNMRPGDFSEIDAIEISNSLNVWVNHCEFSDDPWNAMASPRRHDGLIDIVRGSNWITISNSIFRNHNHVTLIGNSDSNGAVDNGRLKTTIFANWYMGTVQRNPRVRFGEVHVLNNLYTDIGIPSGYGVGLGAGGSIFLERNVFNNCRRAWAFASGVPNPPGNLMRQDNIVRQNSGFDANIPTNVNWRPNQYYSYSPINVNNVESHVRTYAGIWSIN